MSKPIGDATDPSFLPQLSFPSAKVGGKEAVDQIKEKGETQIKDTLDVVEVKDEGLDVTANLSNQPDQPSPTPPTGDAAAVVLSLAPNVVFQKISFLSAMIFLQAELMRVQSEMRKTMSQTALDLSQEYLQVGLAIAALTQQIKEGEAMDSMIQAITQGLMAISAATQIMQSAKNIGEAENTVNGQRQENQKAIETLEKKSGKAPNAPANQDDMDVGDQQLQAPAPNLLSEIEKKELNMRKEKDLEYKVGFADKVRNELMNSDGNLRRYGELQTAAIQAMGSAGTAANKMGTAKLEGLKGFLEAIGQAYNTQGSNTNQSSNDARQDINKTMDLFIQAYQNYARATSFILGGS